MFQDLAEHPGLFFVAATLVPAASFVLLLLGGALRWSLRPTGGALYEALGGSTPTRRGAYIATGAIGLSFVLSFIGFLYFIPELNREHGSAEQAIKLEADQARWNGEITWASVSPGRLGTGAPATTLRLGYHIDSLTVLMFLMVTFIATLIHLFSIGYMADELQPIVEDHQVHTADGHLRRRGRFGRFFLFLSLFCFSMLNLVLADNLFQVFLSWELVGICSYLLVGFNYERRSASNAANKAFITNRVGDVGFILGLLIIWTYVGTFNFQELFHELPARLANGSLPHWLLVAAGLGIFLGCVGKSAQFPLHVWLPDAMEGPTPVSALIHAATMVAAGVYLVGRVYPLFTLESRLVIAYTGAITLFMAASIAVVMTDIKKVLAYSTVSQLGYMMLALGVGGWVAGLFHLLTHAFFKALLFLGSGSVIYGCHHEQNMDKMGGLLPKMKITGMTMLLGVLAISGTPFFSGWYSKDMILAQALGFASVHRQHLLLFLLPLITAGLTTFYMFRMWLLTFAGKPRDHHVFEHAHESPRTMTIPLILLGIFSVVVAWGTPPWQAEKSLLGGHEGVLHVSEPPPVHASVAAVDAMVNGQALFEHSTAELLAFLVGGVGVIFALLLYYWRVFEPADAVAQFPAVYRLLWNKWYVDELYSATLVRPALVVAHWCRAFDAYVIDGFVNWLGRFFVLLSRGGGRFDNDVVDGLVNVTGRAIFTTGTRLRRVQTGYLRSYVLFLVLAVVGIFAVLSYFVGLAAAR
jgi:NADH-quinone oxidoreductase subunit L